MRIAIVAPLVSVIREPHRGGSQAFVSDLAQGLTKRGHDVHLYAASGSEVVGVQVIDTGVDHRALAATLYRSSGSGGAHGWPVADRAFASVFSAVAEGGYDLVHNHAFDAPAITLAGALGAPVVHTLHLPPDRAVADALRRTVGYASRPIVAAVSQSQANAWSEVVSVDAVLPPYVPTRAIPWGASSGKGAVFGGRLSPEKGAAEAIDIAQAAGIGIEVYGDNYDDQYVEQEVDTRRDKPGVAVHPGIPRTAFWEVMAGAAVVLCPAKWEEPFGMVAAEAQACGTPVVGYRRGALPEVIVEGVTGFLVAPDDVEAAAAAVAHTAELSRSRCRDHAEGRLDLELSLDAHEGLYTKVASSGRREPTGG